MKKYTLYFKSMHLPVLPVFFIDVLLDDSASNPSSVSSWYSIETLVSWSAILIGDWFLSWHSGKAAAHPVSGPYVPTEEKDGKSMHHHKTETEALPDWLCSLQMSVKTSPSCPGTAVGLRNNEMLDELIKRSL